jgi:imidazolonepropionase-like amidohydrolase
MPNLHLRMHARCAVNDGIEIALAAPAQQTLHLIYIDEKKTAGWRDIDIAFRSASPGAARRMSAG